MKKILVFLLLITLIVATGCRTKTNQSTNEKVTLVFYNVFDDTDVFQDVILDYERDNPSVDIIYRKFNDVAEYEDLLVNELAEGEGPDIMALHNTWYTRHKKKVNPFPGDFLPLEVFEDTFVSVASDDLILFDENDSTFKAYGIPFYVDNLALYYNKEHFEDALPEQGKPSQTWEGIKEDVFQLKKEDASFERFERAGIALGRADNINRAVDILYLLNLQFGTKLYNSTFDRSVLAEKQNSGPDGSVAFPGEEALELFTSFSNDDNKNYSWNRFLADPNSSEKELIPFVEGKVSMVIGYSYLYKDLMDLITARGRTTSVIDLKDVETTFMPQVFDPERFSTVNFGSYFAYSVSRTSEYPDEAFRFLSYLSTSENIAKYNERTNTPPSRRDLIEEARKDPIYGVFADQIGTSKSYTVYKKGAYEEVFSNMIQSVVNGEAPSNAIKIAQEEINSILPDRPLRISADE